MHQIRIQEASALRLDEIYRYTRQRWGTAQAERYITGLFAVFDGIDTSATFSRPIPAEFAVQGYCFRYEQHIVYWRKLANGDIGIATILHAHMHQIERFREDFRLIPHTH